MRHLQPWQWASISGLIALGLGILIGRISGGHLALDAVLDKERRERIWGGVLMAASIYVQNHPDLAPYTPALVAMGVMSKTGGKP